MRKFKRIISGILSAAVLASSCMFTAWAEGTNTITKVYADSFGLDIVYENAVEAADYADLAFADADGNEVAYATPVVEDKTLHVNFETPIETGVGYVLDIAGGKKSVTLNEEFFEDFEDEDAQVLTESIDKSAAKGWKFNYAKNSLITDTNTISGNRTAVVGVEKFLIRKWTGIENADLTVSVDVAPYNLGTNTGTKVNLAVRGQNYGYSFGYGSFIDQWTANVGIFENSALTADSKKTAEGVAPAFGKIVTATVNAEGNILEQAGLSIETPVAAKKYAVRNYGTVTGAYYDGNYLGTTVDTRTGTVSNTKGDKTYNVPHTKGEIVIASTDKGVTFFDNILVTSCTVADIVPNEITGYYADSFGIDITYLNTPAAVDYADLAFTNNKGEAVAYTTVVDNNILHVNFTTPIETGKTYLLSIDGEVLGVTLNEEFFEDFEDNAVTEDTTKKVEGTDKTGKKWMANWDSKSEQTAFISDDPALSNSKVLAVRNAAFRLDYWSGTINGDNKSLTVSADIKHFRHFSGTDYKARFVMRELNYGYTNSYGMETNHWNGTDLGAWKAGTMLAGKVTNANVGKSWGNITSVTADPEGSHLARIGYNIATDVAAAEKMAVRSYDNVIGGYYGGTYIGTAIDSDNTRTNGRIMLNAAAGALVVMDNILVTSCTIAPIAEATEVTLVNADNYGIVLDTPVKLGAIGDFAGLTITNTATGEEVTPTGASYTGDYLYVDAALECDVPYKVKVSGLSGATAVFAGDYEAFFKVKKVKTIDATNADDLREIGITEKAIDSTNTSTSIIMRDDHVELHNKSFNVGPFDNASISYKLAYYGKKESWGTKGLYSNNIIKGNGEKVDCTVSEGTVKSLNKGAVTMYMDNSDGAIAKVSIAKADGTFVQYQTSTTFDAALEKGQFTETDNVVSLVAEIEPHIERYVMTNDTYRIYQDSDLVYGFVQEGLNERGYVQIGGSTESVVQFYGAEVTQMQLLEEASLNATGITADPDGIYVTFDNSVEGMTVSSGISIKANGSTVNADYTVNGNTITIAPEGGIVSGAKYDVTVAAGFGPSELLQTNEAYNKKFTVTVYANEKFDAELAADSKVKVDVADIGEYTPMAYIDGGLVFRNGTFGINDAAMAANDYTLKFDYKVYSAVATAGAWEENIGMEYGTAVPNAKLWFNAPTYTNALPDGYSWLIEGDGVTKQITKSGATTASGEKVSSATEFGDIFINYTEGGHQIFNKGDDLSEYGELDTCTREAKQYTLELNKQGKGASLYRNGTLISSFTGTEDEAVTAANGYFGLQASDKEFIWIDNVKAYTFKEMSGLEAKLDVANNRVVVENYDNAEKNVVIIVCAYDSSNRMLKSYTTTTTKANVGTTYADYDLSDVAASAAKYKAFVWDNLTNLKPYCPAAVYPEV